ncbi:hypothetical protein RDWZM_009977, partial [Blomia tropicalis]
SPSYYCSMNLFRCLFLSLSFLLNPNGINRKNEPNKMSEEMIRRLKLQYIDENDSILDTRETV